MHGKYFFLTFAFILVLVSPVAGSLTKITAGSPVYIGEQNLDISAGLQGCRVIEWYEPGANMSGPAQKNVTIIKTLEDSNIAFSYTISPDIYSGYEGTWYCEGKRPLRPIFEVLKPQISVRFWDLDKDADVTGQTLPVTANITYRIDTNLDKALQLNNRPDMTSLDSIYSVTLTDPANQSLQTIYTGSYGKADTVGLPVEQKPIIKESPYYWRHGSSWDRTARNIQGDTVYPPGTYSVWVSQNLNRMGTLYSNLYPDERSGMLESSASVTFVKPEMSPAVTPTREPAPAGNETPAGAEITTPEDTPAPTRTTAPPAATRTKVPTKTTYAPVPSWVVFTALGIVLMCTARKKNS